MKKITNLLTLLVISLGISSCSSSPEVKKEEKLVNSTPVSGYFVKNNYIFKDEIETIVINDSKEFNKYFSAGKTMKNKVTKIDFNNNFAVAVIKSPSLNKSDLKIEKVQQLTDKINVVYSYTEGEKRSFSATATDIVSIKRVDFKKGQKVTFTEK